MGRSKTSASASGREGTREASRGDPESVPGDAESGVPTKERDGHFYWRRMGRSRFVENLCVCFLLIDDVLHHLYDMICDINHHIKEVKMIEASDIS